MTVLYWLMSLNKFIKEMVRLEVYSLHLYFVLFYWTPLWTEEDKGMKK